MSIHKIGSDLIRPFGPKGLRGAASKDQVEQEESPRAERSDRVEISSEGRELAAQLVVGKGPSAERMAQIESRIEGGFYDDPSIAEQVAGRILANGDLAADA